MSEVMVIDEIHREIALVENPADGMELHAKISALENVWKGETDKEQMATTARILLEHKIGGVLRDTDRTKGTVLDGKENGSYRVSSETTPDKTLNDMGLSRDQSSQWQKLAGVPIEDVEAKLRDILSEDNWKRPLAKQFYSNLRGTEGTGDNEWYTPAVYIEAAREVLGEIDLDPASSEYANETVKATNYFTKEDNGLDQKWLGRVWMNPPYAQPLIKYFIEKVVEEYMSGGVDEAIVLTHNYTDTGWFHHAQTKASAICFTRGRISFIDKNGKKASPTQGQAFFYYGHNPKKFIKVFSEFGFIVVPNHE